MTRLPIAPFLVLMLSVAPALAFGEVATGVVFEDVNDNGVRDAGEPGVAGIHVQRGAEIVRSDVSGRYSLGAATANSGEDAHFVVVTRPSDFDVDVWYRIGSGDFALRRRAAHPGDFVFAQMSDAHVSDLAADVGRFGIPGPIGRMPRWLAGTSMWLMLRVQGTGIDRDRVTEVLRAEVGKRRDVSCTGSTMLMGTFVRDLVASPEEWVDPAGDFRAALAELRSMAPAFVVSTGDLVIESNKADAATVDRWMQFYARETRATGLRFYDTIGNNELAGNENEDFGTRDPGYGKALFQKNFGPTAYAFDRGDFHFVALDTHRHLDPDTDEWSTREMEDDVREWLIADLEAHRDRRIVLLNHEPFRKDPDWSIPGAFASLIKDTSWLEEFQVPYTFSGHLHINGTASEGGTQHVMTGALSGARWTLPAEAYPRGYRIVQARGGELFTFWKPLGEAVLGFATGADREVHATAPLAVDPRLVVVVASDAGGPVADVSLRVAGRLVELERWSDYFFAAMLDAPVGDALLRVEARLQNGSVIEREIGEPPSTCGNR